MTPHDTTIRLGLVAAFGLILGLSATPADAMPSIATGTTLTAKTHDIAALEKREAALADEAVKLGAERRACTRLAEAQRRLKHEDTERARDKLKSARQKWSAMQHMDGAPGQGASVEALRTYENKIMKRVRKLQDERKSIIRLVVAVKEHNASPSTSTQEAVAKAESKYGGPSTAPAAAPSALPVPRSTGPAGSVPVATGTASAPSFDRPIQPASNLPADLRDLAAVERREAALADEAMALNAERRSILRVTNAMRMHDNEKSVKTKAKLDEAFTKYANKAQTGRRLGPSDSLDEYRAAEVRVSKRTRAVSSERKALVRLAIALKAHEKNPTQDSQAQVNKAIEKYENR